MKDTDRTKVVQKEKDASKTGKIKGTIFYNGIHLVGVENKEEICLIFNEHRSLVIFPKTVWQEVKQELAQLIKYFTRDTSDDDMIFKLEMDYTEKEG